MKRIAILVTFLGLSSLAACKKDVTADLEKLADRACACKDAPCATKVLEDLATLAKNNKEAGGNEERAMKAATKMMECAMKAGVDPTKLGETLKDL
ncbi:MAG: hypothetical protein SFX73_17350 [Kofleriaceae bacterium]|nr:hypothetical protein [Kofleriaceae bacterium]